MRRLDALFLARGSVRAVSVARILLGLIVLWHLRPFLHEMQAGVYYGDHFHRPFLPWLPTTSREVWYGVVGATAVAGGLMAVGLYSRVATIASFVLVSYGVAVDQLGFQHNRGLLVIVLAVMCLFPTGQVLSVDRWLRRRGGQAVSDQANLWPLWLMRLECTVPYVASATSKIIDPDWWGGTVIWIRTLRHIERVEQHPLVPELIGDMLDQRSFHFWAAKAVILAEYLIGLGYWSRRTRYLSIWTAMLFHLGIEMSAEVNVFSWLGIANTLFWVVPATRDRTLVLDVRLRRARVLRFLVRWLDWLARFEVREATDGPAITLIDRDGTRLVGPRAVRIVLSRLPVFFWFVYPTLWPGLAPAIDRAFGQRRGAAR